MGKKKKSPRLRSKLLLLIATGLVLLAVSGFGGWFFAAYRHAQDNPKPVPLPGGELLEEKVRDSRSLRIIATGDMLAHDSINSNALDGQNYDYTKFFAHVKKFTSYGDIRFCNQEGLSAGEPYGITGYPSFNAPKAFPRDLQKIGCNTINLANNHMADKGQAAIDETVATWRALKPLAVSGANPTPADRDTVHYIDRKGIKVAYVTFNETNNNAAAPEHAITMLQDANVTKLMTEARANADFVMVSVHWGSYEDSNKVGAIEEEWAQKLVALGADTVIGTGPHVLQRAEWRDGTDGRRAFVWYSIGNFLSAQLTLEQRIGGIAVMNLERTDNAKVPVRISKVGFLPTYMHYDWPTADRVAEKLTTRTNFALYPLDKAAVPLSRSGFRTTVAEQSSYVRNTLGSDVTIPTSTDFNAF